MRSPHGAVAQSLTGRVRLRQELRRALRDAPVDRFTVLLVQGKIQLQDGTAGLRLSSKSLYVAASFICIVYIVYI